MAAEEVARQPFPGRCCSDPVVQFVGYLGPATSGAAAKCDRPNWLYCAKCGANGLCRCQSSRRSRCGFCASIHKSMVSSVASQGLYQMGPDGCLFLTLTAPGQRRHCGKHRRKGGCPWDGTSDTCEWCPCTSGPVDVAEWNMQLTKNLNRLLEAIKRGEVAKRTGPRRGYRQPVPLVYWKSVEVQDGKRRRDGAGRGALHVHALLGRSDGKPLHLPLEELRQLAIRHGFGHSTDLKRIRAHGGAGDKSIGWESASRYVSKYVSKSADSRGDVPWRDPDGRPCAGRYRSWSSSRSWPVTMGDVRNQRQERHGGDPGRSEVPQAPQADRGPLDASSGSYSISNAPAPEELRVFTAREVWEVASGGREPPDVLHMVDAMVERQFPAFATRPQSV